MGDRDKRGRFTAGNSASKNRKRRNSRSTASLVRLVDRRLSGLGETRCLDDLIAQAVCELLTAAAAGDTRAAVWAVDRFYPIEHERNALRQPLPAPSKSPLEFLDALAHAVAERELSTSQAAKLAHLARPFVVDAELQQLADRFDDLQRKLEQVQHGRLQVAQ